MSRKQVVVFVIALVVIFIMNLAAEMQADDGCQPFGTQDDWCSLTFQAEINEVAWAGTIHAATHEWLELKVTAGVMDQPLSLVSIRESTTTTITLPAPSSPKNEGDLVLYIRTNDANLPHVTADAVYTGALVDSGICELRLVHNGQVLDVVDMNDTCSWPAGSNNPRSSMQLVDGVWHTSNSGFTLDAGDNLVLGTPGADNVLPDESPELCTIGQWPARNWEFGFDVDWRPLVTLTYTSWGSNPDGSLKVVTGPAYIAWDGGPWAWGLPGEPPQPHLELTTQCRQNMLDLIQYMEARLNGNTNLDQAGYDTDLDNWLDALREFQRSGLTVNFMPLVTGGGE